MSGLLPNPQHETSVLTICLNTIATLYTIPYGLGAAVSTRVSNELGVGNPERARVAVYTVMFLTVAETLVVSAALFASRLVFGYVFSNEKEVDSEKEVDYVTIMALVCLSLVMDSLQGNPFRCCKRLWVATYRGICQSWSFLSMWSSVCCHFGFLAKF